MTQEARNPGLAVVFSFIFPGVGQLYNGRIIKGFLLIFLSAISMLVLVLGAILMGFWLKGQALFAKQLIVGLVLFSLGLIFICIFAVYSILNAWQGH